MRRHVGGRTRHVLHVCTKCRGAAVDPAGPGDGARLYAAIRARLNAEVDPPAITLNGIECLSGCNRPCTVGLASPGKPTYLFGDLGPDPAQVTQILDFARRYRAGDTGILPPAERPPALQTCLLAHIPPHDRHG
jgi:predicted metal-binding protein